MWSPYKKFILKGCNESPPSLTLTPSKGVVVKNSSAYPRIFLASLFLLLSACGFQPMYGDNSALATKTPLTGNLAIDNIGGHEGQILKTSLEDLLNPEGTAALHPDYRLTIALRKTLVPAVIKSDGTIQRYDVVMDSDFKLINNANGKVLLKDSLRRTGSYNVAINANFATYEAEQDVTERTIKEMSEDYVLRLTGYFAGKQ